MTSYFYRFFIVAFFCMPQLAGAGDIPQGYSVDRYTSLWKHSPFTIASVEQNTASVGFASKFALVGVGRIGSEDVVTLLNKESLERIVVSSKAGRQDLKLILVEQDADPLKTSVTLQKGDEVGKVKFDQALLAVSNPPSSPGNPQASAVPPNGGSQTALALLRVRRSLPIPSPYQAQPPNGVINATNSNASPQH
ncbi:MAG: hypothetical protein WCD79_03275 [Chthoniobacteraceae bacterium]